MVGSAHPTTDQSVRLFEAGVTRMPSLSIAQLQAEWTDKPVTVVSTVAPLGTRLARFVGKPGVVKTVNQNGRALVQFEGTEDIGWYDIDPSDLRLRNEPSPGGS
jgi:hypothetical protein